MCHCGVLADCRRDTDSMLYIDYSEGRIGMTLVSPHGIWRGNGFAGEVGHVVMDSKGPLCACGARGCLESEAGARALESNAAALLAKDVRSVLRGKIPLSVMDIFRAARDGDRFARTVIHNVIQNLSFSVAIVVTMLHPRFVVVGAETEEIIGFLADDIRQVINARVPTEISATVEVIAGRPTIPLGLIGAGLMMFEQVIHSGGKRKNPAIKKEVAY